MLPTTRECVPERQDDACRLKRFEGNETTCLAIGEKTNLRPHKPSRSSELTIQKTKQYEIESFSIAVFSLRTSLLFRNHARACAKGSNFTPKCDPYNPSDRVCSVLAFLCIVWHCH